MNVYAAVLLTISCCAGAFFAGAYHEREATAQSCKSFLGFTFEGTFYLCEDRAQVQKRLAAKQAAERGP